MMTSTIVYPVGVLVMGRQLRVLEPKATLEKVQGLVDWGSPRHQICPYTYNLMRFVRADCIVPFNVTRDSLIQINSIHAFGPSLIERVVFGTTVVYDKLATTEGDGKLFVSPHRILEATHLLHIQLRCLPELFMLGGRNPDEPSTLTSDELSLMQSHDSGECDDCKDFKRQTGLDQ